MVIYPNPMALWQNRRDFGLAALPKGAVAPSFRPDRRPLKGHDLKVWEAAFSHAIMIKRMQL